MNRVRLLLEKSEIANELLAELDRIARSYDSYEYGLPVGADHVTAEMREAIYRWLASVDSQIGKEGE